MVLRGLNLPTILMSMFLIICIALSGVNGELPVNTTKLEKDVCITNGVVSHGSFFIISSNLTQVTTKPIYRRCPTGSVLLQPGVIVINITGRTLIVDQEGLCAIRGVLDGGIATTIGTPVPEGQNISSGVTCLTVNNRLDMLPNDYVLLFTDSTNYLESLPANTSASDVFFVQDSPILSGITYTVTEVRELVCIQSGLLVDGQFANIFNDNVTAFDKINGVCPNGTLSMGFGILDGLSRPILSDNKCLGNAQIARGRVIVTGELTPVGQLIKSGPFAGLNCSTFGTGVYLSLLVLIIEPTKTSTTRAATRYRHETRTSKYIPYEYNIPRVYPVEYSNGKKDYNRRPPSNYYNFERSDNAARRKSQKPSERERASKFNWQQRQVEKMHDYIDNKIAQKLKEKSRDRRFHTIN